MPTFVGMSVTPEAREALRKLTYALTGRAGRRVELSEALAVACVVVQEHLDEAEAALSHEEEK